MKAIYIVGMIALIGAMIVTPATAATWDVYEGNSIQDALNSASDGDTVFVHAGTYSGYNIHINTPNITLKGEGADVVTYDGVGSYLIRIGNVADATGCVIEGFKIVNCAQTGMEISSTAPDCIIRNNVFESPSASSAIILVGSNTTFMDNVVLNSGTINAILVRAPCTIVGNTIMNSPVDGIRLVFGDAANCIITRNNISSSNGNGLGFLLAGPGNKIYLNNFVDNGVSVGYLVGTPPTIFWNSTEPIEYTYGGSTYTNYLGNYWSDYTGTDGDGDGIGDTSYDIPPGSPVDYDFHPLMAGFENYPAPAGAEPDLTPTAITPPSSIIANISSTIGAIINNTGASDAAAFDVTLSANGTVVDTQSVSGLASGDSAAVSFSWTPAAAGDYSLTVTADSADVIGESDETNNELSEVVTAVTTGYMGSTLTTYAHDVVRGDLLYTIGNSTYRGSMPSGETYTVEFNITDIPAGAAVKTARLYSYWCYSYEEPSASMDVTFDGTLQTPDASYIDRKGYGSYDRPYGTYAYNVDLASNDGYTATITNTGDKFSIYAMGLLVVYEDNGNEVEYWIDEGADIVYSKYGITPEQATTDAPFDGTVTLADVESARLITVIPSGDKGNNTLLFNTYTEAGIWNTPNIAVEERDITSYISSTGNLAQLRDDNADYMMPSGAFLVMQRFYVPPPTSSGVSLGATIRPAISIEVTPGTLNFGTLAPGQTSGEQTLGLSNTGGCNVSVTADVTDTAANLYVAGMLLDSGIWSSYSTEVVKSATDSVGAVLDVPDDYAGVGTQEGALIFWAEKA